MHILPSLGRCFGAGQGGGGGRKGEKGDNADFRHFRVSNVAGNISEFETERRKDGKTVTEEI